MPTVVTGGRRLLMGGTNHSGGNGSRGHTVLLVALHHRHAARNAPGVQIVTGATLLAGGSKAGLYIPQPQGANGNTKRRQLAAQGAGSSLSTAALVAE